MSPDTEATVRELEERAARILSRMQKSGKPLFIEFTGTPKSGKTTIAQNLSLLLRRNGFRCAMMVEKASVAPFGSKKDMRFNIWTACQTLTNMFEYFESSVSIVLIDRGLFDALCWTEMLQMIGEIEELTRQSEAGSFARGMTLMVQVVHVGFSSRGGFVPQFKACDASLDTLPPDEAAMLTGLVFASGILDYPGDSVFHVPGAADVVEYTFTIETKGSKKPHTVTFDSPSLPEAVRPLLRYLLARSHNVLDDAEGRA